MLDAPNDSDAILSLLHTAKTDVLVLAGYLKLVPAPVVRASSTGSKQPSASARSAG